MYSIPKISNSCLIRKFTLTSLFRSKLLTSGVTLSISLNILRIFSLFSLVANLNAVYLCNIIHDIHDVIFSVIYGLSFFVSTVK